MVMISNEVDMTVSALILNLSKHDDYTSQPLPDGERMQFQDFSVCLTEPKTTYIN